MWEKPPLFLETHFDIEKQQELTASYAFLSVNEMDMQLCCLSTYIALSTAYLIVL